MQQIGPYQIIRRLGEGGMGTVALARHVETGHTVAIKRVTQLSGALRDAMRREVWSLAKIQHPNIVRIYDHDLEGETPWYAMEFIRGATLRERLHNTVQHTAIFDSAETHPKDSHLKPATLRLVGVDTVHDRHLCGSFSAARSGHYSPRFEAREYSFPRVWRSRHR